MSEPGGDDGFRGLSLSDSAQRRVVALVAAEGRPGLMLRVSVFGGGCSGFQYGFDFDHEVRADDHVYTRDGVSVVVDEASLELIDGSVVDFVEELIGASFRIANPNAVASCGCGVSFAV